MVPNLRKIQVSKLSSNLEKTRLKPWKNSVGTLKKFSLDYQKISLRTEKWTTQPEKNSSSKPEKNSGSKPEKNWVDFKPEKIMVLKIARVLKSRFTGRD